MLLSMAVLVLPLLLIVLFFPHGSNTPKPGSDARAVDYSTDLAQARRTAPFPVLAPVGLPAGWKATAVHFDSQVYGPNGAEMVPGGAPGAPLRWEVGFISPDGQYVALDQVTATADKVLAVQVPGGAAVAGAGGKVVAGGVEWQAYQGSDRRGLVRSEVGGAAGSSVSVVVSGSASFAELEQFAGALQ
jgi:hypothetical protein